jgi:hypothetical protein
MRGIYEIVSGAMIYIPSFIKIGPGNQKSVGQDTQTQKQHGARISLVKECRLKNKKAYDIALLSLYPP